MLIYNDRTLFLATLLQYFACYSLLLFYSCPSIFMNPVCEFLNIIFWCLLWYDGLRYLYASSSWYLRIRLKTFLLLLGYVKARMFISIWFHSEFYDSLDLPYFHYPHLLSLSLSGSQRSVYLYQIKWKVTQRIFRDCSQCG